MAINNPYALSFDGNDRVSVSSFSSAVNELTVECWVYINKFNSGTTVISTPIISDFNTFSIGTQKGYLLRVVYRPTGNTLEWNFVACDGTNFKEVIFDQIFYDSFISKYANKWLHITGVFKGGEYMKFLINGEVKGTLETNVPLKMQPEIATPTYFGYTGTGTGYLDGKIDEVRIWDVARTQTQINNNKNKKLLGNESGLVGYWRLDEGTGTTAYDSAGSNNGAISGASWVAGDIKLTAGNIMAWWFA